MAEGTPINDQVLKLIKDARRVAYDQGYQDALRDQAALREIVVAPAATSAAPPVVSIEDREPPQQHNINRQLDRAPWGTSTKAAEIALDRAGSKGIDIEMVVGIAHEELGYKVAESSVRSILGDMVKRKELKRGRAGRWHRTAPKGESVSPPASEDTAARPVENDRAAGDGNNGEQRWSHPDETPQPPRVIGLPLGMPEGRAMREASEPPTRMVGT